MKIQHNLLAMNANRNIKINTGIFAKTTEKLASGYKINRAADDAAGLSISEKMRRQIRGLTRASDNCQDGISMVQTAEGALAEVHDMLQRLNELAVQAANGTNSQADRDAIQMEVEQIQEEIDRVSETTTFNSMRLFAEGDGSTTNGTNNGNTPSVTSLDASAQTPAVMSMRSMARAADAICGAFTVSGGTDGVDFSYADGTLTVLTGTNLTITGTGVETTDKIVIKDGITANVTLKNVNIDVSGTDNACALDVDGTATLNLTLEGNNTLKSGSNKAGLQVESGATVNIMGGSGDKLNATGGLYGAGIGGGDSGSGGAITISGGNVTATSRAQAAGIGGGWNGSGGTITISGGEVTATGGVYGGAGIGGGYDGAGGDITISGGVVTATGGDSGAGIGGGDGGAGGDITISGGDVTATGGNEAAGIGGGDGGAGGDITISGGDVTATGGECAAGIGSGLEGDAGTFSTGSNGSATITATGGAAGYFGPAGPDISDTSAQTNWSGTINGVTYPIAAPPATGDFTVSGGTIGTDYEYDSTTGTLTVLTSKDITIEGTGAPTTDKIVIQDGVTANVTLKNVNIDVSNEGLNPIKVVGTATLNLTLMEENTLKAGVACAGVNVENGAKLVITEQSTGSLSSTGGESGAGIGSNSWGSSGDITIAGGTITATGIMGAAGIGGGYQSVGGTIDIVGGTVTAESTGEGAGIGGGNGASGGNITISGGTVTAKSNSGSGIGDGQDGTGGTFSTGTSGNANITATTINGADAISDTSNQADWSGNINGVTYPIAAPPVAGTGDFTVTGGTIGTDYEYDSTTGTLTILTNKDITIEGTGAPTTDKIVIQDGVNANITLDNINIDVSGKDECALLVDGSASLNLTLTGNNTLKSGESYAGLQVGDSASLVISEQSTGSLTATGGSFGAGIGGAYTADAGNITIKGGTIVAQGDGGAGIGGGTDGGGGGNVIISGGDVTATSHWGSGIGGGMNGASGTFSTGTNGNATVTATSQIGTADIADTTNEANWSGWINGVQYGNPTPPATGGNTGTGSAKNSWWIQAGADAGVGISIEIGAMDTKVLGIEKGIVTVKTEDAAGDAITAVGNAIEKLSKQRSRLGAYQNRLEHTILNLDNVVENTTAAESRIRDADIAKEMVDHAKNNILMQAVQSMLSQANAQPEAVLQLLQ